MDNNYIENLGMSSEIDEGLWDRLKSRASRYSQMSKNLFAQGTTDVQLKQFDSLLNSFLKKCRQTLHKFAPIIDRHFDNNPGTMAEKKELKKLEELLANLVRVMDNKKRLEEASTPFSALAAQAEGNISRIMDVCKKTLKQHYDDFLNDARKLNISPSRYINSEQYSTVKPFFKVFNDVIRSSRRPSPRSTQQPAGSAVVAPQTSDPAAPDPASSPVAPPEPPPVAPSAPVTSPDPDPAAPNDPAAHTPTPAAVPANLTPEDANFFASDDVKLSLAVQSLNKLIEEFKKGSSTLHSIKSGVNKGSSKANIPLPSQPPIIVKRSNPSTITELDNSPKSSILQLEWKLRYRPVKDDNTHVIEFYDILANINQTTNRPVILNQSKEWQPLLHFTPLDVVNIKSTDTPGATRKDFDVLNNIKKCNKELGDAIGRGRDSQKIFNAGFNFKVSDALANLMDALSPDDPIHAQKQLKPSASAQGVKDPKTTTPTPSPSSASATIKTKRPGTSKRPVSKKPTVQKEGFHPSFKEFFL